MTAPPPRPALVAQPSEAAGGLVLIAAAILAMIVANLPATAGLYESALHAVTGPMLSPALGPMTVHLWINDALMALFFLTVGAEIRHEIADGTLTDAKRRRLPLVAAAAGMAVPAAVYLMLAGAMPGLARGWAIPAATDIAFAVGILALLGPRVPVALKVFLTAVAVVDDIGAVAIIALAYTDALDLAALAAAAGTLAAIVALARRGEARGLPYAVAIALLWFLVLRSGVHATIAGVAAAFVLPAVVVDRFARVLRPWVAYAIVPLFAFANAGVALGGVTLATLGEPLVAGIAAGLFVGKQAGLMAAIWIADRTGFAPRPAGESWLALYGVSLLAGVGFTMSLFIGGLAFPGDAELADRVRLGVLAGSLLSALAGAAILRFATRKAR